MSFDPNAAPDTVEPILDPLERTADLDAAEQTAEENREPAIPYPQYVMTEGNRERWRQCVGAAEGMAENGQYENDMAWLRFVANQLYNSDIPTG